jgi:hypothetical protein
MDLQMTNCNVGIEIPCKLMNDGLRCCLFIREM